MKTFSNTTNAFYLCFWITFCSTSCFYTDRSSNLSVVCRHSSNILHGGTPILYLYYAYSIQSFHCLRSYNLLLCNSSIIHSNIFLHLDSTFFRILASVFSKEFDIFKKDLYREAHSHCYQMILLVYQCSNTKLHLPLKVSSGSPIFIFCRNKYSFNFSLSPKHVKILVLFNPKVLFKKGSSSS